MSASSSAQGTATLAKGFDLFDRIRDDGGQHSLAFLSAQAGIPYSTAYRIVALFVQRGFLLRLGGGRYYAGVAREPLDERGQRALLKGVARPALRRLAKRLGTTAHLGVLEDDMVTYLIKEGGSAPEIFTREGMQLEAYCSAIGKMLLAYRDPQSIDAYLSAGPFIALTRNTVTDPAKLRGEFHRVREQGFALDQEEIAEGLFCIAVPVLAKEGAIAAISASGAGTAPSEMLDTLAALREASTAVARAWLS